MVITHPKRGGDFWDLPLAEKPQVKHFLVTWRELPQAREQLVAFKCEIRQEFWTIKFCRDIEILALVGWAVETGRGGAPMVGEEVRRHAEEPGSQRNATPFKRREGFKELEERFGKQVFRQLFLCAPLEQESVEAIRVGVVDLSDRLRIPLGPFQEGGFVARLMVHNEKLRDLVTGYHNDARIP